MKEHLYRGKSKESGKWVSGSLIIDGEEAYISQGVPGIEIDSDYWANSYGFPPNENDFHLTDIEEVDSSTVGQYTGLTDRHGTKIFEWDLITVQNDNMPRLIKYEHGYFSGIQFIKGKFYQLGCEVIGNIYDNPELLK